MRMLLAVLLLARAVQCGIVADVRAAVDRSDFPLAERRLEAYRNQNGVTSEMIEAHSWLGRGALAAHQLDKAETYAAQTRKLALAQLKGHKLDDESHLPLALGASIEVHAGVLAARGDRAQAVSFLTQELKAWGNTSIHARIQKNLNLLTLEGKPAPPLVTQQWLGTRPPALPTLKGRAVLLFFWAHWCPDCKAQIPALVRLEAEYGPRGLVLIGPTQHYGYVARGQEAPPDAELLYIDQVRQKAYAALKDMPVPVSEENFRRYGASTVPTLVLVDRRGIVRLYHPDPMSYEELAGKVESVLAK